MNTTVSYNLISNIAFNGKQEIADNLANAMDAAMLAAYNEKENLSNTQELELVDHFVKKAVADEAYNKCMKKVEELLNTEISNGEGRAKYIGPIKNFINIASESIGFPFLANSFMPKIGGFAIFKDALIKADLAKNKARAVCGNFLRGINVQVTPVEASEIRSSILVK